LFAADIVNTLYYRVIISVKILKHYTASFYSFYTKY